MRPPTTDRRVLKKHFGERHKKCRTKKESGQVLDEFVAQTGYCRSYEAQVMRLQG